VGFLFKDATPYGSIRSEDPAEVLILEYFEFAIYLLSGGYDALPCVPYGGAVSDR